MAPGRLTLHADRRRQLTILDPTTRQLLISCGCALFNARVSLAASGLAVRVERFPNDHADVLATLTVDGPDAPDVDPALAALDPLINLRHTNRRQFADEPVPAELVDTLVRAASAEGAYLHEIVDEQHRDVVALLSQRADALQNADPAYRAELRAWTTDDPSRRDGVPALAVPHVAGGSGDEIPIRDFDSRGTGWLPTKTRSSRKQCMVLLATEADDAASWLRAGEALERVLLEIARHGFTAGPLTQVVEVASARAALRRELSLTTYPLVLLRIGRAAVTPGTSRRDIADVLTEETADAPGGRSGVATAEGGTSS